MNDLKKLAKPAMILTLCLSLLANVPLAFAEPTSRDDVQAATQAAGQAPSQTTGLFITILDGEGALNDIRQRTAREPIVQVEDENHKPVAGALVLFSLPSSGPGGSFAAGAQTFSTVTDSAGRAVAQGLKPNNISGSYSIHVHVNYNGLTSETDIHQRNGSEQKTKAQHNPHAFPTKVVVAIAAIAVAGTIVGILASQGNSPTTITVGPTSVNPPPTTAPGIRIPLRFHSR